MTGEFVARNITADHLEQRARMAGGAGADGVAERNFIAAHGEQLFGYCCDLLRRDLAFIRATEHAGHIAAHADAMLLGGFHHRHKALQALANRTVDVFLREGLAGGGEHRHFLHSSGQGILKTFEVRRQCRIANTRALLDLRKNLSRTGHLWHPLGRHEAAHLDIAEASGTQVVDQTHLVGDADRLFLVLQAVARADFDQAYLSRQIHMQRSPLTW